MGKEEQKAGAVVPLSAEQIFELLEASIVDDPSVSAAALMCQAETLLLRSTGATSVDAFLVNRRFNKLFRFSATNGNAGVVAIEPQQIQHDDKSLQHQHQHQQERTFHLETMCDIGEGVAGIAAKTGRKLRVRDCSAQISRALCPNHTRGNLVCWPIRERLIPPPATAGGADGGVGCGVGGTAVAESAARHCAVEQLEDMDRLSALEDGGDALVQSPGAVLAVLQVYSENGELPAEAFDVLRDTGRLLAPLLTDAVAFSEENVRRRTAEALHSLSTIVPREMELVAMVEEVISVAERLTNAERVCLFFVDDVADELWVAKSADFDGTTVKVGHGLCGNAAATGQTVNVIDAYKDSRFTAQWDEQTGFITKSVLCVPIPPPDQESYSTLTKTTEDRWGHQYSHSRDWQSGGDGGGDANNREEDTSPGRNAWISTAESKLQGEVPRGEVSYSSKERSNRPSCLTPIAVLEVMNKRGGGVFDEHEENALVRMCASVESLLRRKAAEVALLKSGMNERSWIRRSSARDGIAVTSSSNYARIESAIVRLYSETVQIESAPSDRERPPEKVGKVSQGRCSTLNNDAIEADDIFSGRQDSTINTARFASSNKAPSCRNDGNDGDCTSTVDDEGVNGREKIASCSNACGSAWKRQEGEADQTPLGEGIEIDSNLLDFGVNMFGLSAKQQLSLVTRFFWSMGLMETFDISHQTLRNFVSAAGRRYHANPFHNLTHATSVTHAVFIIIKTTRINSLLRPLDKLGLLTAAFCHDIDHPGNNNAYEVNSLSPLALLHGDSSVLERHHIHVTYQVLLEGDGANNIFSELTRTQFQEVRQVIIQAILATDMSTHMHHCAELAEFAQKAKNLHRWRGRVASGSDAAGRLGTRSILRQWSETKASSQIEASGIDGVSAEPAVAAKYPRLEKAPIVDLQRSATWSASTTQGAGGRRRFHWDSRSCSNNKSSRAREGRRMDKGQETSQLFSVERLEDRLFLSKTIVHCADLSGQVVDNQLAQEWGRRILEEFHLQAEREARAGLPSTVAVSNDPGMTVKAQHFFLTRIVKPLWSPFVTIFPELEPLLGNLNRNCDFYQREATRLENEPPSTTSSHASGKRREETVPAANQNPAQVGASESGGASGDGDETEQANLSTDGRKRSRGGGAGAGDGRTESVGAAFDTAVTDEYDGVEESR